MSTRPELEAGFDGCGIFEGVPLEIYLRWAGISHHDWWILNKQTPEEYKHRRDHPRALNSDALRARLGEVPAQGEEAPDGEAKG